MDRRETAEVIAAEGLDTPVIDGVGQLREDSVVVDSSAQTWRVYLVDERAQVIDSTVREFDHESAALDYALVKLREVDGARRAVEDREDRAR
ncbi:hypothetical protein [Gordonia crocea]|uniref:Uncharacterized protein n=1 Tax=Gordonia crocea TaxID=589162 RepID=A0A7M3SU11_9ACTN|nr:hypothetical protein [Gordonia crocea]GED96135.1 hypothetical protein nbrc107697_01740 [Gordonia crocea]